MQSSKLYKTLWKSGYYDKYLLKSYNAANDYNRVLTQKFTPSDLN